MAVFDFIKTDLFESYKESTEEELTPIAEEEIAGDPQALVDGMIENAPNQREHIGVILKYAANSDLSTNIWDAALAYYNDMGDEPSDELGDEEPEEDLLDTGDAEAEANGEAENGDDPLADELSDDLPAEEETDEFEDEEEEVPSL